MQCLSKNDSNNIHIFTQLLSYIWKDNNNINNYTDYALLCRLLNERDNLITDINSKNNELDYIKQNNMLNSIPTYIQSQFNSKVQSESKVQSNSKVQSESKSWTLIKIENSQRFKKQQIPMHIDDCRNSLHLLSKTGVSIIQNNTHNSNWKNSPNDYKWTYMPPSAYNKDGKASDISAVFNLLRPPKWLSAYSYTMQSSGYTKGGYLADNYWYIKNPKYSEPIFRHYFDHNRDSKGYRIVYHELYDYNTNLWNVINKDLFALIEHDLLVIRMKHL